MITSAPCRIVALVAAVWIGVWFPGSGRTESREAGLGASAQAIDEFQPQRKNLFHSRAEAPPRDVNVPTKITGASPDGGPQQTKLVLDRSAADGLLKEKPETLTLDLPLPAIGVKRANLRRFDLLTPDARVVAGTDRGDKPISVTDRFVSYSGRIEGDEESWASFSLFGATGVGFLRFGGTQYVLAPMERRPGFQSGEYALYPESAVNGKKDFTCAFNDADVPPGLNRLLDSARRMSRERFTRKAALPTQTDNRLLEVRMAIDSDFETFQAFGGDEREATAYLLAVMANVSQIYMRDVNIKLTVTYSRVWTTANDPYSDRPAVGVWLNEFARFWSTRMNDVQRDLAHFMTVRDSFAGTGVAMPEGLCSRESGYAVSASLGRYDEGELATSAEVSLVAHEIGHNFSSPHTHSCLWPGGPIDRCSNSEGDCAVGARTPQPGTIMSYCQTGLEFGPLPSALIRARAEASCANSVPPAPVTIAFRLDASALDVQPGDKVGIQGSRAPLGATDFIELRDEDRDGVYAGDITFLPVHFGQFLAYRFTIRRADGRIQVEDQVGEADDFWHAEGWKGARSVLLVSNRTLPTVSFNNRARIDSPILLAPDAQAAGIDAGPRLSWRTSPGTDRYWLQVAVDPDFTRLVVSDAAITAEKEQETLEYWISPLQPDVSYFWRVRGQNATGRSDWSEVRWFTVRSETGPPNNAQQQAQALTPGSSIETAVDSPSDFDFFTFPGNVGETVELTVTNLPEGLGSRSVLLYDNRQIFQSYFFTDSRRIVIRPQAFQPLFLRVSGSTGRYRVTLAPFSESSPNIIETRVRSLYSAEAGLSVTVQPNNRATTVRIEYGTTPDYGMTLPVTETAANSVAEAAAQVQLTGLTPNTPYHYRIIAENSLGRTVSPNQTFFTPPGSAGWNRSRVGIEKDLLDVWFTSPNTGVAVGGGDVGGTILRTTDGGVTWTRTVGSGTNFIALYGVHFPTANFGCAVGTSGTILRTTDGGQTWTQVRTGNDFLLGVHFINEMTGTAVGSGGLILRTTDGGRTWSPQASRVAVTLVGVTFTDERNGVAVGNSNVLLRTTDGGATWTRQNTSLPFWTGNRVVFTDASNGFAAGTQLLRTSDGGRTWSVVPLRVGGQLLGIHFSSPTNGVTVASDGRIFRTTDGGATWRAENSGTRNPLYGIFSSGDGGAVAVGLSSTLLIRQRGF